VSRAPSGVGDKTKKMGGGRELFEGGAHEIKFWKNRGSPGGPYGPLDRTRGPGPPCPPLPPRCYATDLGANIESSDI